MHAVLRQARLCIGEEIDEVETSLRSDPLRCPDVLCKRRIVVRDVRQELAPRFLEGRGSHQRDLVGVLQESVDQRVVCRLERLQPFASRHRFELAVLRNDDRGADPFELGVPVAKAIFAPTLQGGALAKDRVRFPGEITEGGSNLGERVRQDGLEKARALQIRHVGAAGEHNHVPFPQVQRRRRLRAARQEQSRQDQNQRERRAERSSHRW